VFFGSQRVVYTAEEESIPHVGLWEDEDHERINRVNQYWRAVGRPGITGLQCQKPWSAAFISWLMLEAGVPEFQFKPSAAHWVTSSRIQVSRGAISFRGQSGPTAPDRGTSSAPARRSLGRGR